jgi:hypothetical protein
MTFDYNVYDLIYYEGMTIIIYVMQYEDTTIECVL